MLALRILEIVFPLFSIGGVGFLYGRLYRPDLHVANRLNLEIFVPALAFSALYDQQFELNTYLVLTLCALAVLLGSGLLAWPLSRLVGVEAKTFVPPMMFSNCGNMGLPLQLLAFGEAILPVALVLFLTENLLHFTLGIYLLDHRARLWAVFRQPLVLAALVALVVGAAEVAIPRAVALPIEMLGQISIPLMLFSLGARLAHADMGEWRIGLLGAVVAPATGFVIALALVGLVELPPAQAGALLLFGALPPAVLNFIIAERYAQEPAKVAAIVIIGNLFALVSIPVALAYVLPRYA